jgi:hypothetical protein
MKPKFTRMIDGILCMTVTEHEHIVESLECMCGIGKRGKRDWSLLEATQESLREHMAEIQRLKQRQWVGLTDEEIIEVLHPLVVADLSDEQTDYEIARAIEAKLKEKNNG